MPRSDRKNEHIYYSLSKAPACADFSEIHLVHNCLPNLNIGEISLNTTYMGRTYRSPLFINALTGGTRLALRVNAELAVVARVKGMPMAVGSQMAALEKREAEASFKVIRRVNPRGSVWANIGSYATPSMAEKAIKMIRADGLQIHLNVAQELMMPEGECNFGGMVDRIAQIVKTCQVPVIAKEVGFGIAREQALEMMQAGVKAIDIAGRGGTNFIAIESKRSGRSIADDLCCWGIPTAISITEVNDVLKGKVELLASGGINSSLDMAKALALGANAVGMAGLPIYLLMKKGRKALISYLDSAEQELRLIMMMLGVKSISELRQVPCVITGLPAEWLQRRGIDPSKYAKRKIV
jgi:isopentenyl-diphosphate Delta-isomerase